MSEEDILEIAHSDEHIFIFDDVPDSEIIKFARAIEAKAVEKEREACISACEHEKKAAGWRLAEYFDLCIAAIRARGE